MKCPPFVSAAGPTKEDYLSEDGAHKLAAKIRHAWAAVGHDVPVEVHQVIKSLSGSKGSWAVYAVRMPTVINGMPVR